MRSRTTTALLVLGLMLLGLAVLALPAIAGGRHGPNKRNINSNGGVTICHIPPGNPDNARTKTVGASSVASHLSHGDVLGDCDGAECDVDADCPVSLGCDTGVCVPVDCDDDDDCWGGVGGVCDDTGTGQCCDPSIPGGCTGTGTGSILLASVLIPETSTTAMTVVATLLASLAIVGFPLSRRRQ